MLLPPLQVPTNTINFHKVTFMGGKFKKKLGFSEQARYYCTY